MKKLFTIMFILFTLMINSQVNENYSLDQLNLQFNSPMAVRFHNGFMVVLERAGKIWVCEKTNNQWVKRSTPIYDFSEKVTTYSERGAQNMIIWSSYVYIYYTVEEDYLFGFPQPAENGPTINRIDRIELAFLQNQALSSTLKTILGSTIGNGIPSLAGNHQGGGMVIAPDGSLYVATGDGGSNIYSQEASEKGIQRSELGNLSAREKSQTLNCLSGKILKLYGWTGEGLVSNPFYNGNKNSILSKIWSIGVRNPFRITSDSDSRIYVADVGGVNKEEINVIDKGGLNLGWGKFEGMDIESNLPNINPDEGISYNDLITQSISFDQSSDDTQRRYTHHPPDLDYGHGGDNNPRIISYINDEIVPIPLEQEMSGSAITGGVVLDNFGYPGSYLFSDWGDNSINIAIKSQGNDRAFDDLVQIVGNNEINGTVMIEQHEGVIYIVSLFGKIYELTHNETLSLDDAVFKREEATLLYHTNLLGQFSTPKTGLYFGIYKHNNKQAVRKELYKNGILISN